LINLIGTDSNIYNLVTTNLLLIKTNKSGDRKSKIILEYDEEDLTLNGYKHLNKLTQPSEIYTGEMDSSNNGTKRATFPMKKN
jgi:hypothetical protein